ncbi:MAG: Mov34/MPN/PAD-1 family protein [Thaumarchaeota archaeon]|nr:Mov34/MPN/PAD-1 family protein [Nitrososphaerota archaeon]
MRARIYPLAIGKVIKHTLSNLEREVAGLLIGKYLKKNDILEIWDAVTGAQRATSGFVYLDENTIAAAADWVLRNRPGLYIVGWYHSHPGFSLFLSAIDIETQKRYQMMFPKAVALVVDPVSYAKTRKLRDLKFKVFRLDRRGRVVQVRTTIGIHRRKVLESTIQGMELVELKYLGTPRRIEEVEIDEENLLPPSLSSVIKKFKEKLARS